MADTDNYLHPYSAREIRGIVLHSTEGPLTAATSWFQNPASGVSAHYGIGKVGSIVQWVEDRDIAFHVRGDLGMYPDWIKFGPNLYNVSMPNAQTLGIELELLATDPDGAYTDAQLDALRWLLAKLMAQYGIPAERVIRHADIQADRHDPRGLDLASVFAVITFPVTL
ncbi:MAG: peptidoglycan recognition family protein [Dehalococcoidia bacterium]|nr:peptidoglycan recognition family protein [Dehalococcoidia bacterium]